jgi:hypothetical protein
LQLTPSLASGVWPSGQQMPARVSCSSLQQLPSNPGMEPAMQHCGYGVPPPVPVPGGGGVLVVCGKHCDLSGPLGIWPAGQHTPAEVIWLDRQHVPPAVAV